ncbi:hypothetical protein ISTM_307 [Insectomime virus]|nr:hypothetical protein ISTM_307 [Insectomime virus]
MSEELQKEFLDVVERMKDTNTSLPQDFVLYYRVMIQKDKKGTAVALRPFLTSEQAEKSLGQYEEWEGEYGRSVSWRVCDSWDRVSLENTLATDEEFEGNEPLWTKHDVEINVSPSY